MPEMRWTQSQWDAIEARSGPILVSAAAGSGKTAVLVRRVLRMITDPAAPIPADRLLIVTFSNAAAAEMKERVERQLEEMAVLEPDNGFLRQQQLALQSASIGTIHAFCLNLIRQNFQLLSLPADLRVADERELDEVRREVLEELIAQRYASGDETFLETVELFSAARNDQRLLRTVLRLYDFTRSHPFPERWLAEKLKFYEAEDVGASPWGEEAFAYAEGALSFALEELRRAALEIGEDEKLAGAYLDAFLSDMDQLARTLGQVKARDWDGAVSSLRALSFQKLRPVRGYDDDTKKKRLSGTRKSVKDLVEKLRQKAFCATRAECAGDLKDLRPKIAVLFSLVTDFASRFELEKRERKALDFSDLEQYALKLLCEIGEDGEPRPTPYALSMRPEYEAILIDEYQDTNEAQEKIFSCLTDGSNLFLVGDVKQSIYGFRQASPQIFMHKKDVYPYYDSQTPGRAKIILGANFRSHPAVCEGINGLFGACMSRRVGQIDYGADERLIPLGSFPERSGDTPGDLPGIGVSFDLIDVSGGEEDAAHSEARYVAGQIARLLGQGATVYDQGATRPMRPGDIAILLRSPKGRAGLYLSALAEAGVPAFSGTQSTFLQTAEIGAVTSILRSVSNPLGDVPLVAAMMSPVYAFSAGDVARIRLYRKDAPVYLALLEGARQGDGDCARFLADLQDLRREAAHRSTPALLRYLYERTALPHLISALDSPQARLANLHLLIEYARSYERAGYRTLTQFLRFLSGVEDSGQDLTPANLTGAGANAVHIMSIHRSKGLEFPVVFVCDCAKRFNRDDLRQNVLLHSRLGVSCMRRDAHTMSQVTTVPLEAARLAAEREMTSEELRVLYVALTRARERLILTAALPNPEKKIASMAVEPDERGRLPEHAVSRAQSPLDWLLMSMCATVDGAPLCEFAGIPTGGKRGYGVWCRVVHPDGVSLTAEDLREEAARAEPSPALALRLEQVLRRRYPFEEATRTPTKMAVTALVQQEEQALYRYRQEPQFVTRRRATSAQRGDAFHQFMLFADHEAAKADLEAEIGRLVRLGFLSGEAGVLLGRREIAAFYETPLYERVRRSARVEREFRFMSQLGQAELGESVGEIGEETVTVQGICDLLFFEDGQGVLVDYKTDRVTSPDALRERYSGQLLLYADMLRRVLEAPVKECILYSTALGMVIPVAMEAACGRAFLPAEPDGDALR